MFKRQIIFHPSPDLAVGEVASVACKRRCLVTQFLKQSLTGGKYYHAAMTILPAVTHFRRDELAFPVPDLGAPEEHYLQVRKIETDEKQNESRMNDRLKGKWHVFR